MDNTIIPVQSEYDSLITEIRQLKLDIAALTAELDDLRLHICRDILADYNEKVGNLEYEALQKTLEIKKLRRVIEYIQAAINRQEQASIEDAQKKTEEDYKQYEEELKKKAEDIKKNAEFVRQKARQEEKNRQEAERRNAQARNATAVSPVGSAGRKEHDGSASEDAKQGQSGAKNSDTEYAKTDGADAKDHDKDKNENVGRDNNGSEAGQDAETETKYETPDEEIKRLYRKIVKKLHPDMNPDITEEEKRLLQEAMDAYERKDLERLREIAEQIDDTDIEEKYKDTPEDIEKLRELRDRLLLQKIDLEHQIRAIKEDFPYNMKEFLADEEQVKARQNAVRDFMEECDKEIEKLNARIEELRKKLKI